MPVRHGILDRMFGRRRRNTRLRDAAAEPEDDNAPPHVQGRQGNQVRHAEQLRRRKRIHRDACPERKLLRNDALPHRLADLIQHHIRVPRSGEKRYVRNTLGWIRLDDNVHEFSRRGDWIRIPADLRHDETRAFDRFIRRRHAYPGQLYRIRAPEAASRQPCIGRGYDRIHRMRPGHDVRCLETSVHLHLPESGQEHRPFDDAAGHGAGRPVGERRHLGLRPQADAHPGGPQQRELGRIRPRGHGGIRGRGQVD